MIIANLLRCINPKSHAVDPFADLWRPRKGKVFGIPPSAAMKYRRVRALAADARRADVTAATEAFFDERIRNAFSHSDYIITDDQFRFADGRLAQGIPMERLDGLTVHCFAFFGAFIYMHKRWLRQLGKAKRFHQMPRYEVLELLSSEEDGLYGFHMHFSNGSRATYARRRSGIEATNLFFERDGGINFQVGLLDKCLENRDQCRKISCNDLPQLVEVDVEVGVRETVACSCDGTPGHLGMALPLFV